MDAFTQEMQEKLLKERDELLAKLNAEENNFREEALSASGRDLVLSVRHSYVEDIIRTFHLADAFVIEAADYP